MSANAGTVAGLLLAGGRGARFDASGVQNKLLAALDGQPVAVRSAHRLLAATRYSLAVVRPGSPRLAQCLNDAGLEVVECADAELGMGHSLACGAAHLAQRSQVSAVLVALADMPFIAPATYAALIDALRGPSDIVVPRRGGERGHPVLFGAAHLPALTRLTGDRGASALLQSRPLTWVEVDDAGILQDIDRPSDLPDATR